MKPKPQTNESMATQLYMNFDIFQVKMLQSLLPTRERLHMIGKIQSSSCLHCNNIPDTTAHLLSCTLSSQVSISLVNCLRNYQPGITLEEITLLKIPVSDSLDLPLSWPTSTCMSYIWEKRVQGKQAMLDECRADIMGKLNFPRDTKWKYYTLHNTAVLIEDMINLHYTL